MTNEVSGDLSAVLQPGTLAADGEATSDADGGEGCPGATTGTAKPETTQTLVDSVVRLVRLSRRFGDVAMFSLPWLPYAVLHYLDDIQTDVRLTELSDALAYDISVLSRQVNGMIDHGLLTRVRDPNDGRAWLLRLTDHGRLRLHEASRRRCAMVREYLAAFDDAEQALCAKLVDQMSAGLIDAAHRHTAGEGAIIQ